MKKITSHVRIVSSVVLVAVFISLAFAQAQAQVVYPPAGARTDYLVGLRPVGIAFDSVTNSVWTTNIWANTVSKVDINTGARIDYPTIRNQWGVAFDNITNSVWIVSWSLNTVSKIDINTGARIDYTVGRYPNGVAFDNVTNSVWVTNFLSGTVSKVDINTGARIDYTVGGGPQGITFDNITNSMWVTNYASGTVSKIDIFTGARVDFPAGEWPVNIAFDSATNSVWVTNVLSNTINKINILTGVRIGFPVGEFPQRIAFDNVTNSVWVTNYASNTVSKVDINTGARIDYPVGLQPFDIAFDSVTNSVWVTNSNSNTVSKIAIGAQAVAPQPSQFFSQIQNAPNWLRLLRGDHNLDSNIIKTVPNDWVLKVATTTDSAGNLFQFDGYQWYGVIDITDGVTGWMSAKNLIAGTEYLSYDASAQISLANKAATTTSSTSAILQAVDNYYTQPNTSNSLYGGGGGIGNKNNFQTFIQGSQFPKELILAMATQESGSVAFDNEIVTFDYGHGIMQATFQASTTNALMNTWDNRGVGSEVTIPLCKSIFSNDYKKCYANSETQNNLRKPYKHYDDNLENPIYKQYANTLQSIYANIKDGFRVIQDKYRKKCPKADILVGGYIFTCQDIEKMLTVWGYNGFGKDRNTGLYTGTYLKDVAEKLETLGLYFPGIVYAETSFIQKMKVANAHKQVIRVYSPVTFSVIDSVGRITGLVNDSLFEEIPNSLYERNAEGAVIFFPSNLYRYRVVGTTAGIYKFSVDDTNGNIQRSFRAIDIATTIDEIHEYLIDWDALDRGERGVTVLVDTNGDGLVDRIVKSDGTLTEIAPPMVTVVSPAGEYLLNATTTVQFSATDTSGIATISATLNGVTVSSGQLVTLTKPGVNTLEVIAMDNEGNEATATSTFSVFYNMSGFLLPVTSDGSKVYNQGRSLPVKFELRDVNGKVVPSVSAQLYIAKVIGGVVGRDEIPTSTTVSSTGNQFRYDAGGHMYIFNLSTDAMSPGTWQIKAVLDSGQEIKANILIR